MLTPFWFSRILRRVYRKPRGHPLRRVTRRFYRSFVVLERGLRGPLPEITPRCAIELEMLDRSEIAAYLDFHPGRQRRFVERRFAAGDACFTARHRGELLAVQWSCRSQHWVGDLHSTWCVGPGEVYLYDSYTHPQYRGQGVNPALCVHVLRHFGDLGLDRATLVVESGNASNLRSREKLGFERRGVIRSLSIGWGRPLQHRSHFAAPATTP